MTVPIDKNPTTPDTANSKRRVTLIGGVINLFLGLGKILAGVVGQSQALIVDGIHSLSDLISDALVLVACAYGSQSADGDHPYGHGRIETVASAGIGAMLLLVAGGFIYDAVQRLLIHPEALLVPGWLALTAACASIAIKEGLYHYTKAVAREARSNLLEVNAWHHRSDALSSLVVVGGITGVLVGLPWLDAVAAIIVAAMLAHVGLQFAWRSLRELVDTALTPDEIAAIEQVVRDIEGVRNVHGLRTRRMGQDALADLHVIVDPRLSVSEGHRISEEVHERLMRDIQDINDVLVHIEHEDPEWDADTVQLPLRREVERDLRRQWGGLAAAERIERLDLHYMEGALEVEIHLPWQPARDLDAVHNELEQLAERAQRLDYVTACRVHFVGR
ncbi:cation diffusion facilitator family transporter [Aquisalimonas sp.]|uniref:cation diffusion facilitator family transporter n=1 Tax=Aquisalimonas sp. TaxID=1872621 RepID=UPI0025C3B162|nr:cation diffusion facilitator family transporter [Aquisalimonas sp.]